MRVVPSPVMWNADYDYVRLTTTGRGDVESAALLYRQALSAVLATSDEGRVALKPWLWQGYYGVSGGNVQHGTGTQGAIFQASGWAAAHARSLDLPYTGVPRVDVALTLWYEADDPGLALRISERSRAFAQRPSGRAWKVTYVDGGEDGATCYIGSRNSDVYIRCYDKWRESGKDETYRYAWRLELEAKNECAQEVWAGESRTAPDRAWLAGVVAATLRRRGIYLPDLGQVREAQAPVARRVESDSERRLAWLRNQVAPAVDKLLADGVSSQQIAAALGLNLYGPGRTRT